MDKDGGTTMPGAAFREGKKILWNQESRWKYDYLEREVIVERIKSRNVKDTAQELQLSRANLHWPSILEPPDFDYVHFYINVLPSDVRIQQALSRNDSP